MGASLIGVVGSGYVGTVVAACFAKLGNSVVAVERDPERLHSLLAGNPGFHEEGLPELLSEVLDSGSLTYADLEAAVRNCEIVFMCLGTPPLPDGHADVSGLEDVVRQVGRFVSDSTVLVTKSTAPVGTSSRMQEIVRSSARSHGLGRVDASVVSNPEFLREGTAIADFLSPERIVLGGDESAVASVAGLYEPILSQSFPGGDLAARPKLITTDTATAEMTKYASNAFLATKISFINQMAQLSESAGSDVTVVADAMGLDSRIGPDFLNAGVGWGGSCFGKDLSALIALARDNGVEAPLLEATASINMSQRKAIVDCLEDDLAGLANKRISLLGLAFKPGTSDTRDAPAVDVARWLLDRGATVVGYDPAVKDVDGIDDLETAPDPYSATESSHAVVVMTDWPEFADLDFESVRRSMSGDLVVDGRNMLDPSRIRTARLRYVGIGRQ